MTFFKNSPLASNRTVTLSISIPELHDLIKALLRHWDIEPCLPGQEMLELQASAGDTHLSLLPRNDAPETLTLPFKLESLWLALQTHLFDPPRQHFRMPLRLRGTLRHKGAHDEFVSVSLSDAGIRFEFFRELVRDEEITLEIPIGKTPLKIEGRVIYCVPTRNSGSMIVGVVYSLHQEQIKERIRSHLVKAALQQIGGQMERQSYLSALSYLDLSEELKTELKDEA